MCPPPLRARQGPNTTIKLDNSPKCSAKNSGQNQECWIVHIFFNLYPPPLWDIEDRRRWGHNVEDSDIEDRQRWGQATLRTGDAEDRRPWGQIHPPIHFPTLGPKGPQKPSNLHIFSNVGSIYPIKYVHSPNRNPQNYIFSPNVGSIYPIKHSSPKCWHHISNIFSNVGSIYPIKYVHTPSVDIIYPIFLTIFENFNNFANFETLKITYFLQMLAAYIQ